jgi:hypothetical protein
MLGWKRFVRVQLLAFFGIVVLLALFVLAMNPYGNLPSVLFSSHAITDINQRFQYPALVRSSEFDSILIGTSDARLLDPAALERTFGGRFANLAMNAALAWEQYRLAELFIRKAPQQKTLIVALDHVWCDQKAAAGLTTFRGFPDWMYDDDPWNDLAYMLNGKSVEIGFRRLATALGLKPARFHAGYEVFTPPEEKYDRAKVAKRLWGSKGKRQIKPTKRTYAASSAERAAWEFPALAWLDQILAQFPGRVVLAFMPIHVRAQPVPGSAKAAKQAECKARIAAMASRRGASPVIDFGISSSITTNDDNYWDPLHYRLPIADRIVSDLARALETGVDDPNGDWLTLQEPGVAGLSSRR